MGRYGSEVSFPIFLRFMLDWDSQENAPVEQGYLLALILSISIFIRMYSDIMTNYFIDCMNARVRNSVRVKKLQKVLKMAKIANFWFRV